MNKKNQDELDGDKSIFAAPHCRRHRSLSKNNPFCRHLLRGCDFCLTFTVGFTHG